MEEVHVRQAGPEDTQLIVGILVASKEGSYPETIDEHDRDVVFWEQRWRGYLTEGSRAQGSLGDGYAFIAEVDGQAVGFAAYHHTRRFATDAELQSIYVLKGAQGRGVGTRLLQEIVSRLEADGSRTMCVGYAARSRYNRFYEKYGAKAIGPEYSVWDIPALARRMRNSDAPPGGA